jgi:glycosyltransferase involved in cell wall biosynthesis
VCLLYSGSIGEDRIPEAVIHALVRLPHAVRLRILGFEARTNAHYTSHLRQTAEQLGVADRVEILPGRSRDELWPAYHEADVGLSLRPLQCTDPNFLAMVGATNKAFDYFASGMPLIVSDLPEWRESYVALDYARACLPDDPDSIASALQWYYDHPVEMRRMGEAARKRVLADWNYEYQFRSVHEFLEAGLPVRAIPRSTASDLAPSVGHE